LLKPKPFLISKASFFQGFKLKYFIASDHAGFALKNRLKFDLKKKYEFEDLGAYIDERVDYPEIAIKLAKRVAGEESLGVLICGTGIGMSIVANKLPGARAAVIYDGFTAKMARQHNNANIACVGGRCLPEETALQLVETFLATDFLGKKKEGKRHLDRVRKIEAIDKKHFK